MTGKGNEEEGRRMGEGCKHSQISDRQELPPQREAITGGWRGETEGSATELIGNLLARPSAGRGDFFCPGT